MTLKAYALSILLSKVEFFTQTGKFCPKEVFLYGSQEEETDGLATWSVEVGRGIVLF